MQIWEKSTSLLLTAGLLLTQSGCLSYLFYTEEEPVREIITVSERTKELFSMERDSLHSFRMCY